MRSRSDFEHRFRAPLAVNPDGLAHGERDRRIGDDFRFDTICHAVGPGLILVFQSGLHLLVYDHLVDIVESRFHRSVHARHSVLT